MARDFNLERLLTKNFALLSKSCAKSLYSLEIKSYSFENEIIFKVDELINLINQKLIELKNHLHKN